jgi:hypothetical protein
MNVVYQIEKGTASSIRLTLAAATTTTVTLPTSTIAVIIRTALTDLVVAQGENPAAIAAVSGTSVAASQFAVGAIMSNSENVISVLQSNATDLRLRSAAGGVVDIVAIKSHQDNSLSL